MTPVICQSDLAAVATGLEGVRGGGLGKRRIDGSRNAFQDEGRAQRGRQATQQTEKKKERWRGQLVTAEGTGALGFMEQREESDRGRWRETERGRVD